MRRVVKYIVIGLIAIFVLLNALALFTQTALFRKILTDKVTTIINDYLEGEFAIESIEGNFYDKIVLNNISLRNDKETVLELEKLSLNYLLHPLLRKQIRIKSTELDGLKVNLTEENGRWNFEDLLPINEDKVTKERDENQGFSIDLPFNIRLNSFEITNVDAVIVSNSKRSKLEVNNLNIELSAELKNNSLAANLSDFRCNIVFDELHTIVINEVSSSVILKDNILTLEQLLLRTDNTRFSSGGDLSLAFDTFDLSAKLNLYNMNDIAYFVPILNPDKNLALKVDLDGYNDVIALSLNVEHEKQALEVKAILDNPLILQQDINQTEYMISVGFNSFDPMSFLKEPPTNIALNGNVSAKGKGFDIASSNIEAAINLNELEIETDLLTESYIVKSLNSNIHLNDNRTTLAVSLVGADDLSLNIEGNIEDLNEMKGLSLKGSFDNIDLSLIDPLRDINSDLNFNLIFQATDLNNIDNAEIVFSNSTIDGLDLKELELKAKYIAENIDIETFKLNLEGNTFETSGSYGQTNDLIYKLSLHNLSPIFDYFLPELNLLPPTVELNGKVAGEIDNLITNGKLNITDIKYEDITAQGLSIDYDLSLQDWAINTVSANVVVDSTTLNSIAIDKIGVNGKLAEDTVQLTIRVDQDTDNYGTLSSTIDLKDDIVVYPLELDINVGELHFTLEDGDIKYGTNKLEINSFVLTDGSQALSLLGFVSPNEEIGMELNISNLDLTTPSLFIDNYPITEGALNLDLNASGLFDTPDIKLDIELNNVGLADLDDIELKTNLLYNSEAKLAEASLSFSYHDEEYLNSSLYLPADLSLSEGFQIDSSENAKLELSIKEIDLSNFKELIPDIQGLKGLLAANITVEGKGTDLSPKGELSLENTAFGIKELGNIYDDVSLHLKLDENNLYLTDLKVKSDKGKLSLDGQLTHNGSFDLEKMTNLSLKVKADDFPVISTEAIDIIIDTDIEVSNTLSNPVAKGVVTIPSGKIDVDKLMANSHHSTNFDKPLLVAARETEEDDTADEEFALPLFDPASNIKAEVTLSIPKNFWIRSSDMNIELGGSIDVLINDGNIRLFGSVNTLRGFYIFYGKRFDLINGVITFSGGELLNPNLNVETVYKFRGANSRNNSLSLLVSGGLEDVEVTFLLNGEQIEEGDAISYILFGRSFDELSQNEQGEVSSQSAIISKFFANKVAEQVASVVGDRLQLDLLKFSSDTTKSQFGIEVGKYLTDDLFISYKRDFSFSDSKEPVYEEIIVEYELIKNLFLQAIKGDSKASGLDLIWRMRWK